MWYIKVKNKQKNTLIKNIFKTKQDAFNFMKSNKYSISDVVLINGDLDLVSDDINIASTLSVKSEDGFSQYGIIEEITNYLVLIRKKNGHIAEFTKSRINKEYVTGVFNILK